MAHACTTCWKNEEACYEETTKKRLIATQKCFHCDFWGGYVARKDDPASVRINGRHYMICREPESVASYGLARKLLGCGGDACVIAFYDGRIVVSHNVWHQGDIPNHFKDQLPDNAVNITKFVLDAIKAERDRVFALVEGNITKEVHDKILYHPFI